MIASMGPPCVPAQSWNQCEPAMTVVPDFLITGILAIIFGLITVVWSAFFVQRRHGGLVLVLLSIPLLLLGGGIFPPLIGIIAGALGTRIYKPLSPEGSRLSGGLLRCLAALWPWSLAVYVLWVFGQWILGHFFNDWLLANGYIIIVMVLGTLLLTVVSTYPHDRQRAASTGPQVNPARGSRSESCQYGLLHDPPQRPVRSGCPSRTAWFRIPSIPLMSISTSHLARESCIWRPWG
jgi:hypothetical protein